MRHLVIGQRQKAPNFSAFHWSPHGCLITIGQHFVTTMVVHLSERSETSLITELDQSRANHQLLQLCTVSTAWSESEQAVRAVHSCISWYCWRCWVRPRHFFSEKIKDFRMYIVGQSKQNMNICSGKLVLISYCNYTSMHITGTAMGGGLDNINYILKSYLL